MGSRVIEVAEQDRSVCGGLINCGIAKPIPASHEWSMATITLDLKQNKDLADLVSTMSPGDGVRLETSIKSLDDQTLVLTLESAEEGEAMDSEDDDDMESDEPEGNGQDQTDPEEAVPPAPPMNRSNY